ncbi:MAG: phosphotransferase [Actinomycetota bacterium]
MNMSAGARVGSPVLDDGDLDARRCPGVQTRFRGLSRALDADEMRSRLEASLFGENGRHAVERCAPGKIHLGPDDCVVRYELEVRQRASGARAHATVSGRLFGSRAACLAHMESLQVLAAQTEGRPEIAPFEAPIALLEPLDMAVQAFPIDPDLPALVEATDGAQGVDLIRRVLPASQAGDVHVEGCDVTVAHYPRRNRCVLRYEVQGRRRDTHEPWSAVLFGKVFARGQAPDNEEVAEALRRHVMDGPAWVTIPRFAGKAPELRLSLLEAIPGAPKVGDLVKERAGREVAKGPGVTLEEAIERCASIASRLHRSGLRAARFRSLEGELAALRRELSTLRPVSPRLCELLEGIVAQLAHAPRPNLSSSGCFSHGDYTPSQILFDGSSAGMVDLDDLCEAEPALDLGQFLAYLEVAARKVEGAAASGLGDRLRDTFLDGYLSVPGSSGADRSSLPARVAIYERVTLVRMAIRGWRQLKPARVALALSVLQDAPWSQRSAHSA